MFRVSVRDRGNGLPASSRRSNQSQQKQRQQAGTETIFVHCFRLQYGVRTFRCAGLLFQPGSIHKEASGNRDTSFQNVTKCDADLHENLYASVMLIDGKRLVRTRRRIEREPRQDFSATVSTKVSLAQSQPKLRESVDLLDPVALLHNCFPCFQDCRAHLITLPSVRVSSSRATK